MTKIALYSHLILVLYVLALASGSEAGPACSQRHEGTDLCATLCTERWGWFGKIMGSSRWGPVMSRDDEDPRSVARKHCHSNSSNSTSSASASVTTSTTLLPVGDVGSGTETVSSSVASETTTLPAESLSASSSEVAAEVTTSPTVITPNTLAATHGHFTRYTSTSTFATTSTIAPEQPQSSPAPAPVSTSSSEAPAPPAETPQPSPATSSSPAPVPTTSVKPTTQASAAPAATTSPSTGATSGSDIDQYLSAHNTVRAQHGANPLTWSEELASKAQQWANGCKFQHSGGSLGPYGENLAAGTGSGYNIAAAIKSWTDEASEYDPSNPQYSHFTQVVWKSTTQLGCAVASCDGIFPAEYGKAKYYVCEYYTAGNVAGQFPDNVQA